jgi:GMP synthase-like glutamine amidotransferase
LKPVGIFRFARTEGPGHFATFLAAHGLPFQVIRLDEGEPVPCDSTGFSGLGFMGGPMSANDELPWTQPVLALMRDAAAREVPMIGHCLGGQLLSRALGGRVARNPVKEIGWIPVEAEPTAMAREWLGDGTGSFESFQWHEDTFTVPNAAERILTGRTCTNQAYVAGGLHLGMQCHIEMDAEMIDTWCHTGRRELEESAGESPTVQDAATIRTLMGRHLPGLTAVADRLYARWIRGLVR